MGSSSVTHSASSNSKNLKQGTYAQRGGHRTNINHKEYGRNAKSEVDDADFEMQLCYNEDFSDENDYMWLSPSGRTPCSQSRCSFSDDSSTVDSFRTSLDTWDEPFPLEDTASAVWLPLFDLEGEEPNWDVDADDLDVLDQGFLGPFCHRRTNREAKSSSFSCSQDFEQLLIAQLSLESTNSVPNLSPEDLLDVDYLPEDSDAGEPLFWPFDQKSYWSTELEWSYLDISPFGSILNIGRPTGSHPSKLFQFRLHQRNNSSLLRKKIQQRCTGRMPSSSTSSQSHLAGQESRDPRIRIPNDIGTPSERCRSTRLPPDMARCSLSKKGGGEDLHRSNSLINKHGLHQKTSLDEYLLEFEAHDFQIYLTGEIPIEALLGLDEFDGHEGIGRTTTAGWSTE